jgi:hypothetical protein
MGRYAVALLTPTCLSCVQLLLLVLLLHLPACLLLLPQVWLMLSDSA